MGPEAFTVNLAFFPLTTARLLGGVLMTGGWIFTVRVAGFENASPPSAVRTRQRYWVPELALVATTVRVPLVSPDNSVQSAASGAMLSHW